MALSSLQIKMLRRLLETGNEEKIAHAIEKIHPADLTILFSELSEDETRRLVNSLYLVAKAGKTLSALPEFMIPAILELFEDKRLAEILTRIEPDDALFLLEKIPEERWRPVLDSLPVTHRKKLDKLLLYPKNSAGTVMNSNFISVRDTMRVEEAIDHLRQHPDIEGIFYIYVVDEANRLVGVQSLRGLVMASQGTLVRSIMNPEVYFIYAKAPQEEAAQMVSRYNLLALPVLSESRELLGVITVDDVIDIVKEAATEDIYHLAGLSEEDRTMTPLLVKVRKRFPWMVLNLATAVLAASVVGLFQESIQKAVVLAVFMPIVAGMGGNGAAQSLAVIIRSIALGELNFVKVYKTIFKEAGSGLLVGAACGLLGALAGYVWLGNIYLGLVLFLAMSINMLVGGLTGAAVPIFLKTLKFDPAVGSSVIVTTFTDVIGFFSFLGIGTLMMKHLVP